MEQVSIASALWQPPSDQQDCEVAISPALWQALLEQSADDEDEPEAGPSSTPLRDNVKRIGVCLSASSHSDQRDGRSQSVLCWARPTGPAETSKTSEVRLDAIRLTVALRHLAALPSLGPGPAKLAAGPSWRIPYLSRHSASRHPPAFRPLPVRQTPCSIRMGPKAAKSTRSAVCSQLHRPYLPARRRSSHGHEWRSLRVPDSNDRAGPSGNDRSGQHTNRSPPSGWPCRAELTRSRCKHKEGVASAL